MAVTLGANEIDARLIRDHFNKNLNDLQTECGDIVDKIHDLQTDSPDRISINWNPLLKNVKKIRAQAKLYQAYVDRERHKVDSRNIKTLGSLQKRVAIIQEILPD